MDFTGQFIARRYRIIQLLGQGGMCDVYKAYDTRLERRVAVKSVRTDQFSEADLEMMLTRFDREAKALAQLSHPYIVAVMDYGKYKVIVPRLVERVVKCCGAVCQPSHSRAKTN